MVNTKGVEVIAEGIDAIGNASMYGVVNGAIPTLVGVSADPADDTGKNVFELEGSGTSATVAFGPFLRTQYPNAKTIAIAYQNLPGAVPISQAIQKSAQAIGLHRHDDPLLLHRDRPDRPGDADGAGGRHRSGLRLRRLPADGQGDERDRREEAGPLRPAVDRPARGGLTRRRPAAVDRRRGDREPGLPARTRASRRTSRRSRRTACRPANAINPFSGVAFGSLLLATKVMNEIPFASLSPSAITAKLKTYTGPIPLGPTTINCSGTLYPADTNSCSDYDQFYEYQGHGQWKLLEGWSN